MKPYEIILEKIIKIMEKEKTLIWQKDWVSLSHKNFATKRPYEGYVNRMLLSYEMKRKEYSYPYWLTFKQAKEKGWTVRKGEKGTPVIYYSMYKIEETVVDEEEREKVVELEIPILRYYYVFNIQQLNEFPETEKQLKKSGLVTQATQEQENLEKLLMDYCRNEGIRVSTGEPAYSPKFDAIRMLPKELFKGEIAYLGTFAHETVHSTGHPKRLNRFTRVWEEKEEYAFEELIAEIGSSFLLQKYGIMDNRTTMNNAAYIKGWIRYFREHKKALFMAAAKAEKAIAYIERAAAIQNKDVA